MKKFSIFIFLFCLFSNISNAEETNKDIEIGNTESGQRQLTDEEIDNILKKMEERKKTQDFLKCVEILRESNVKKRIIKDQIKRIQCRLKYSELNAKSDYQKGPSFDQKKVQEKYKYEQQQIEENKKLKKSKEEIDNELDIELTKIKKLFFDPSTQIPNECKFIDNETKKNMPECNIEEMIIARNWKNFNKNQTISYDDVQDLNESDFFSLPLKNKQQMKILSEFKNEFRQFKISIKKLQK
tara:strand:+ start:125 stop:847 length:723 start_codon:yes stop_codon:yes gene_type:complete